MAAPSSNAAGHMAMRVKAQEQEQGQAFNKSSRRFTRETLCFETGVLFVRNLGAYALGRQRVDGFTLLLSVSRREGRGTASGILGWALDTSAPWPWANYYVLCRRSVSDAPTC